ncbi:PREDICTED: AT1G71910 [Prunus dulcis]|uniref:PREDICTED: AT1G71910 n=1 Tax=Prunus dulcis TaxID=3755 RepID=A0A5E4GDN5_PRUDU|nr:uncharacterized protein LOC117638333 [Prunus dulcis]VVA37914.1 PREDICTED: AT1G71910 [Prunus dulcis]
MATQDFSFPTHKFPCTIDSPPLWRLSPAASSKVDDQNHSEEEEEEEDDEEEIVNINVKYCDQRRKSFSYIERGTKMVEKDQESRDHDHGEEKMDMLWEDFNEELKSRSNTTSDYSGGLSREMLHLGCVKAFKLTKTNGDHALSTRKPSVVAVMKVLKRLFFLHNSHHKLKKPAW